MLLSYFLAYFCIVTNYIVILILINEIQYCRTHKMNSSDVAQNLKLTWVLWRIIHSNMLAFIIKLNRYNWKGFLSKYIISYLIIFIAYLTLGIKESRAAILFFREIWIIWNWRLKKKTFSLRMVRPFAVQSRFEMQLKPTIQLDNR